MFKCVSQIRGKGSLECGFEHRGFLSYEIQDPHLGFFLNIQLVATAKVVTKFGSMFGP